eukprot:CAMPEP_0179143582 /NCGR_PEP_ID=MMETSP0796-20121207/69083_1 /TAXON_ID=73915 /ORGANISM="Pyrodinium bahamense, Strain pbaha01" /LENGTH=67 /DNA_ID=CAMNT_0020843655 /DNA_START=30 /DNA_END=233 /DNA_ORIENTATION=-
MTSRCGQPFVCTSAVCLAPGWLPRHARSKHYLKVLKPAIATHMRLMVAVAAVAALLLAKIALAVPRL